MRDPFDLGGQVAADGGDIWLTRSVDALASEHGGDVERLSATTAATSVSTSLFGAPLQSFRDFLVQSDLFRSSELSAIRDTELIRRAVDLIERGDLVVLRARPSGTGTVDGARARNREYDVLLRVLEEALRGAPLMLKGRRYRLVAHEPDRRTRDEDGRVLPLDEARPVLTELIASPALAPPVRKLLKQALDLLTEPRSAGDRAGERLVLVREPDPVAGGPRVDEAPATTPSRLRAELAPEHWIEIEVVYEDGAPYQGTCVLELPGGTVSEGPPNEEAIVRVDGVPPGSCKVSLPALDAGAVVTS